MSEKKEVQFPAPFLVHWPSGPVSCCEEHASQLQNLGAFLGSHIAVTENENGDLQCENCRQESNEK